MKDIDIASKIFASVNSNSWFTPYSLVKYLQETDDFDFNNYLNRIGSKKEKNTHKFLKIVGLCILAKQGYTNLETEYTIPNMGHKYRLDVAALKDKDGTEVLACVECGSLQHDKAEAIRKENISLIHLPNIGSVNEEQIQEIFYLFQLLKTRIKETKLCKERDFFEKERDEYWKKRHIKEETNRELKEENEALINFIVQDIPRIFRTCFLNKEDVIDFTIKQINEKFQKACLDKLENQDGLYLPIGWDEEKKENERNKKRNKVQKLIERIRREGD